jgi:hypothetical protein
MFLNSLGLSAEELEAGVTESFNTLSFSLTRMAPAQEFVQALVHELASASSRDRFELQLEFAGNMVSIGDTTADSQSRLQEHCSEFSDEDAFSIDLKIHKSNVDSCVSIYSLNAISKYLSDEPLRYLLEEFSRSFNDGVCFEVYSEMPSFGTASIRFFQANTSVPKLEISHDSRLRKIALFKENTGVVNLDLKVTPSDFYLLQPSSEPAINAFFSQACEVLSLLFLSNAAELSSENRLSYKICGYKTVVQNGVDLSFLKDQKLLYKIYEWAYEGGNYADKLGLIRNVISIHVDPVGKLLLDTEVWEAIQSNYQIYLKENIQAYLEVKNKVAEFVLDITTKTYAIVDDLLDSFKSNVAVLGTFLLTVVVINGLKDGGEVAVFSKTYVAIVIVLSALSGVWLLMMRIELLRRFETASAALGDVLKQNYKQVLMQSEIDDCVGPATVRNRGYLKEQLARYTCWWIGILLLFCGLFIFFHWKLTEESKASNEAMVSIKEQSKYREGTAQEAEVSKKLSKPQPNTRPEAQSPQQPGKPQQDVKLGAKTLNESKGSPPSREANK